MTGTLQVEELHSWERSLSDRAAALHARENEIETKELDLARQQVRVLRCADGDGGQMYVEQREREVQMKMISTKEIRNEINNELLQWEAGRLGRCWLTPVTLGDQTSSSAKWTWIQACGTWPVRARSRCVSLYVLFPSSRS